MALNILIIFLVSIFSEKIHKIRATAAHLVHEYQSQKRRIEIVPGKLAELAKVSPQMINCIEGCRTWVSDKMLVKLSAALEVETFQLLLPVVDAKVKKDSFLSGLLDNLQQNIKDDIDSRFAGLRC